MNKDRELEELEEKYKVEIKVIYNIYTWRENHTIIYTYNNNIL